MTFEPRLVSSSLFVSLFFKKYYRGPGARGLVHHGHYRVRHGIRITTNMVRPTTTLAFGISLLAVLLAGWCSAPAFISSGGAPYAAVRAGHSGPSHTATTTHHASFIIVGAGAAGLQWGIMLENAGIDYVILERALTAGTFFARYPRRRRLISVNKRFYGRGRSPDFALRHDWHSLLGTKLLFPGKFSREFYPHADDLVRYQRAIAEDLNVVYNVSVRRTDWSAGKEDGDPGHHVVTTSSGETYTGNHVILATGYRVRQPPSCLMEKPRPWDVRSYEDFPEAVNASGGDDEFCADKHVAVLGSGNAAFETADMLASCAASVHIIFKNKPRFSWKTHYVGDVRLHNGGLMDRYQLKSLDAIYSDEGMWRRGDEAGCAFLRNAARVFGVRSVVYSAGFTAQRDGLVDAVLHGRFPNVTDWWADPRQPNRWYAGCLMHSLDFKESAGGFIHGFRYLIRAQFRHIRAKHFGVPWPSRTFADVEATTDHARARVQNSSGLYQMSDFLVDLMLLMSDGSVKYYEEVPRPWLAQVVAPGGGIGGITLKMMFSNKTAWNFEMQFDDTHANREEGLFIHPVFTPLIVSSKRDRTQLQEGSPVHISEDLLGTWSSNQHAEEIKSGVVEACLAWRGWFRRFRRDAGEGVQCGAVVHE